MPIRVLVVDDSLTVRRRIVDILTAHPDFDVVGEAADGHAAVELCRTARPDVITLDMMLPGMNGLEATEHIMGFCPTPILIVSASFNRGELLKTYDALAAGAVDVLEKPNGTEAEGAWEQRFLDRVRMVARIRVITHPRVRLGLSRTPASKPAVGATPATGKIQLIAIGASTGGPGAVVQVLQALPRGFPVPILLVIHIGEAFGQALADWLDGLTHLAVTHAKDGEPLPKMGQGRVVMAPPGRHLVVQRGRLRLLETAELNGCRPSVDALFDSVADELGAAAAACLLTGMGRDGASGLLRVRQAGGLTIAQDEATAIVWGMPREAVALGAAAQVLPVKAIGPALAGLAQAGRTA